MAEAHSRIAIWVSTSRQVTPTKAVIVQYTHNQAEALSEITTIFGENHDVWNEEFMTAWDKMVVNGYTDNELVEGPQYSWLGYSFLENGKQQFQIILEM